MESPEQFDLSPLHREWIEGVSESAFRRYYGAACSRIAALSTKEIARGILIAESNPVRFSAAFFAALSHAAPLILANPKWAAIERKQLADLVNPGLIFGHELIDTAAREGIEAPQAGDILIPTGGSTGGVKLAVHRWETLCAGAAGAIRFLGGGAVNACCILPLFHVSGLMQLVRCFLSGGRIAFTDCDELLEGHCALFNEGDSCVSLVPTQLQRLLDHPFGSKRLEQARAILLGGAPMPKALAARARAKKLPIVLSYGMTETAAMVAAIPSSVFLSNPDAGASVFDHVRIEVPGGCGEPGRIRIAGACLFKGYHGQPSLDLSKGYLTDDEGFFDQDGGFHVLGRIDRLIVTGGEKVDPREVEATFLSLGLADEVLVIGWPDPQWGQKVVAFYVCEKDVIIEDAIRQKLRGSLAAYKIPKQLILVNRIPFNSRGKLDREYVESLLKTT